MQRRRATMQKIKPGADLSALMKVIADCKGGVYFHTATDHINLKSVLSQYVFFSLVNSADAEMCGLECSCKEDYERIAEFIV